MRYIGPASRDPGPWHQRGVVVLDPQRLVFVPIEPRVYIAAIAAKAVFSAATGGVVARLGRSPTPQALVEALVALAPGELERALADELAQDAIAWSPAECELLVERLPLGVRVSFCTHDDRVMVLNAKATLDDPTFAAATAAWPRVPEAPPSRPMSVTAAAIGGALGASIGALTLAFSLVFLIGPAWDLFAVFLVLGLLPAGVGAALLWWARSRWRAHQA